MAKVLIDIWQQESASTLDGRVNKLGTFKLDTQKVRLGKRRKTEWGNGAASDLLVDFEEWVRFVEIMGRRYVVEHREVLTGSGETKVESRPKVTLHADTNTDDLMQFAVKLCPHCDGVIDGPEYAV